MDAPVDLRSDTVSRPSAAMRHAMATAEVGDDWYGDDPTVNRLQDLAAELTGKPAAAYLPTGTMCNQIALSKRPRPFGVKHLLLIRFGDSIYDLAQVFRLRFTSTELDLQYFPILWEANFQMLL